MKTIIKSKPSKQSSKTFQVLSGEKTFDPLDVFPSTHLKGYDCDGQKIKPFDFIAHTTKNSTNVDFVEQADANCNTWAYGGYIIETQLTKAWTNLEKSLLKTIRNLEEKLVIDHKDITITINPKGGRDIDCDPQDQCQFYPTFEFTNKESKDSVFYEYFQLSAHDRALIALDLIEKIK
jgi:hypothetical protein